MSNFVSMATLQNETVDCRMVQLELEFYHLDGSQLKNICIMLFDEILNLLGEEFYLHWSLNGKHISGDALRKRIGKTAGPVTWGCCGDVTSAVVWNAKTFKEYDRKLQYRLGSFDRERISVNYLNTFQELFTSANSKEKIKAALMGMFNMDHQKKMALWRNHDLTMGFYSHSYHHNANLYYGTINVSIALPCLRENSCPFSAQLVSLACKASELISNISGRVMLSPIYPIGPCSGHMEYFGKLPDGFPAPPFELWSIEWNPFFYLQGAEWFNLISPLQRKHLPSIISEVINYPDVTVCELSNGGITVQCKKGILKTDISELLQIKHLLYNALFPGKSEMLFEHLWDPNALSYNTKPRPQWEYVPMFDDEITVLTDRIVFQHKQANHSIETT